MFRRHLALMVLVGAGCGREPLPRLLLQTQQDVEDAGGTPEADSVFITGSVRDLTPLRSLAAVVVDVTISHADELVSLDGLENIRDSLRPGNTGLSWDVEANATLGDVSAIEGIQTVVSFQFNPALVVIDLPSLVEVQSLGIDEMSATVLSAPHLTSIVDTLSIGQAPYLCEVDLPVLTIIGILEVNDLDMCWPYDERAALAQRTGAVLLP